MSEALKREKVPVTNTRPHNGAADLWQFVPDGVLPLKDPQTDIPRIAKDKHLVKLIGEAAQRIPTTHRLNLGDARVDMSRLPEGDVHLVVTSPP
jgi:hypothetical protein